LQLPKPTLHKNAHVSAWHAAVAFGGTGHRVHAGPQADGSVFTTHFDPHARYPGLQVSPQRPRMHSTVA
jgi:hypothetical protein